jgi:hypothetical protein
MKVECTCYFRVGIAPLEKCHNQADKFYIFEVGPNSEHGRYGYARCQHHHMHYHYEATKEEYLVLGVMNS